MTQVSSAAWPVNQIGVATQGSAVADVGALNTEVISALTADAVVGTIPAGGTGAAAGGWDTANNRDAAIAAMTDVLVVIAEMQVDEVAMQEALQDLYADVAAIRTTLNALLASLRAGAIIAT